MIRLSPRSQWFVITAACLLLTTGTPAWGEPPADKDRSFFGKRKAPPQKTVNLSSTPSQQEDNTPAKPLTDVDELTIPTQEGSIKETYEAKPDAPIIIHIQDAHANYEAQKHLANILEHLIKRYGLSLILVEGGSRNDSLSYMRTYAPLEKRKEVAEQFLKAGKISGENYLDLTTDYPFTVFGIEKPELYDANMGAFLKVEQAQPVAKQSLKNYWIALERIKDKLYPKEVKDLEVEAAQVAKNEGSLTTHYQKLANLAAERKVNLAKYPNMQQFLEVSKLEKTIDFKQVEVERGKVLEELTKTLPKEELDSFLERSKKIKKGIATAGTFYRALKAKLTPEQLVTHKQLAAYCNYLERFESINHASLFSEVDSLAEAVKDTYFTSPDQRTLARIAKDVEVLTDLVDLKLIPEKHEYYESHKNEFDPARWGIDLTAMAQKNGIGIPEFDPTVLKKSLPPVEEFYSVARQRDLAMVDNAMKQLGDFKVNMAVFISGGFHTPAVATAYAV